MSEQAKVFSSEEQALLRLQSLGWEFVLGTKLILMTKPYKKKPVDEPKFLIQNREADAMTKLGILDSVLISYGYVKVYIKKHKAIGLGS